MNRFMVVCNDLCGWTMDQLIQHARLEKEERVDPVRIVVIYNGAHTHDGYYRIVFEAVNQGYVNAFMNRAKIKNWNYVPLTDEKIGL